MTDSCKTWHTYLRHQGHPYGVVAFLLVGDKLYSGVSITSPDDVFDRKKGVMIARGRASAMAAGSAGLSKARRLAFVTELNAPVSREGLHYAITWELDRASRTGAAIRKIRSMAKCGPKVKTGHLAV